MESLPLVLLRKHCGRGPWRRLVFAGLDVPSKGLGCSVAVDSDYTQLWASLVAHVVKRLPTMWETRARSLGREDPLEKEMATHSSILAWKIPWTEDPGRLQSMGLQRVGHS